MKKILLTGATGFLGSHFSDWLNVYCDKIKCINLKLDYFYGPNDKPIKFVTWLIEQLKTHVKELNLREGLQKRDFIYIEDVVKAYACIVENLDKIPDKKVSDFEVGTNVKTTVKHLVLKIKELTNNTITKINFDTVPYRKNEVFDYDIDTKNLKALGWSSRISLKEGLAKSIEIKNELKTT